MEQEQARFKDFIKQLNQLPPRHRMEERNKASLSQVPILSYINCRPEEALANVDGDDDGKITIKILHGPSLTVDRKGNTIRQIKALINSADESAVRILNRGNILADSFSLDLLSPQTTLQAIIANSTAESPLLVNRALLEQELKLLLTKHHISPQKVNNLVQKLMNDL